jgi:hypothetical protein
MKRSPMPNRKSFMKRGKSVNKIGRRGKRNLKAFYINRDFFEKHEIKI